MTKPVNAASPLMPKGAGTAGEVTPISSASVILLRGEPFEVLFMRRPERSTFVPGAWVFPGGALEAVDREESKSELDALKKCALRELREEASVELAGGVDDLVLTARWITPVGVPKRFDTCFFLAKVDATTEGKADEAEALELIWATPAEALRRQADGSMQMVFATIKNVEALAAHQSADALLESRRDAKIRAIQPVLVVKDGRMTVELPDER